MTRSELKLIPSVADPDQAGRRKDQLFRALDGSRLRRSNEEFGVEVYSITDQIAGRWIQVGLRGTETQVTLRLPRQAGFAQASNALLGWMADPAHVPATFDDDPDGGRAA